MTDERRVKKITVEESKKRLGDLSKLYSEFKTQHEMDYINQHDFFKAFESALFDKKIDELKLIIEQKIKESTGFFSSILVNQTIKTFLEDAHDILSGYAQAKDNAIVELYHLAATVNLTQRKLNQVIQKYPKIDLTGFYQDYPNFAPRKSVSVKNDHVEKKPSSSFFDNVQGFFSGKSSAETQTQISKRESESLIYLYNIAELGELTQGMVDEVIEKYPKIDLKEFCKTYPKFNYNKSSKNSSSSSAKMISSTSQVQSSLETYEEAYFYEDPSTEFWLEEKTLEKIHAVERTKDVFEARLILMAEHYYWIKQVTSHYKKDLHLYPDLKSLIETMEKIISTLSQKVDGSDYVFESVNIRYKERFDIIQKEIDNFAASKNPVEKINELYKRIDNFGKFMDLFESGDQSCDNHLRKDDGFKFMLKAYRAARAGSVIDKRHALERLGVDVLNTLVGEPITRSDIKLLTGANSNSLVPYSQVNQKMLPQPGDEDKQDIAKSFRPISYS